MRKPPALLRHGGRKCLGVRGALPPGGVHGGEFVDGGLLHLVRDAVGVGVQLGVVDAAVVCGAVSQITAKAKDPSSPVA